MLAGLKEFKNWVIGIGQPWMSSEYDDYRKIEYSVERHLHTPQTPRLLTYEEESRIKTIKYH